MEPPNREPIVERLSSSWRFRNVAIGNNHLGTSCTVRHCLGGSKLEVPSYIVSLLYVWWILWKVCGN